MRRRPTIASTTTGTARQGTWLALAAAATALTLTACGATIEDQPLSYSSVQPLVQVREYPVYWLGERFDGMPLITAGEDAGGAYTLQYGQCAIGGQQVCVTPLEVISSPANGFLPGAGAPGTQSGSVTIRGVRGLSSQNGRVIELRTGTATVELRSRRPAVVLAAARQMTPINFAGSPGGPLPQPQPDTGFADRATSSQRPPLIRLLPPIPQR